MVLPEGGGGCIPGRRGVSHFCGLLDECVNEFPVQAPNLQVFSFIKKNRHQHGHTTQPACVGCVEDECGIRAAKEEGGQCQPPGSLAEREMHQSPAEPHVPAAIIRDH